MAYSFLFNLNSNFQLSQALPAYLGPALITGLSVSFLHAALPTHWLPFVLASRSQKWSVKKMISILLIAGLGHILTTALLGALVVWFGVQVQNYFEAQIHGLIGQIAVLSVFLFAVIHIYQHFKGQKHSHCDHHHPQTSHSHALDHKVSAQDGWAILSLLALLTFSPCEAFIPIYVAAWSKSGQNSAFIFMGLTFVLALGTLVSMTFFTALAYYSSKKLKLDWIENHEKLIIGFMLLALSFFMYFTEIYSNHNHG